MAYFMKLFCLLEQIICINSPVAYVRCLKIAKGAVALSRQPLLRLNGFRCRTNKLSPDGVGKGNLNPYCLSAAIFWAFWFVGLSGRQPACALPHQNSLLNFSPTGAGSFNSGNFSWSKEKTAANTWRICKGFDTASGKIDLLKPTGIRVPFAIGMPSGEVCL